MFSWKRTVERRRVLVNLKTEKAFSGYLWKRGPLLVIRSAMIHEAGRDATKVDGEVVIERVNVDFIQVFPTEG